MTAVSDLTVPALDVARIRADFPILSRTVRDGKPAVPPVSRARRSVATRPALQTSYGTASLPR